MPVYEYRCQKCQKRFSIFWRTISAAEDQAPTCPRCGSTEVRRLISRVRFVRSGSSLLEGDTLDDLSDFDENDPKSLGRMMRRMRDELGDEAGDIGPEFDEVVSRLEKGESPEEIEKALPDLGAAEGEADAL
jgi:putative FmdB family regulatory protein